MIPIQSRLRAFPARALRASLFAVTVVALAGFGSCDDSVTGPGTGSSESTMSRSWPNEDGRAWNYAATYRELSGSTAHMFPTAAAVPRVTMHDVDLLLGTTPATIQGSGSDYVFLLQFSGDRTTMSAVTGQNLEESFPPVIAPLRAGQDAFLARVALARPDLRARLARYSAGPATLGVLSPPILIHGYAWIKGPQWIGTYGDVDTILAWKFLDASMVVGHTFQQQLVPSLANDILLTGKVSRKLSYVVPGLGTVRNCFELHYLIDYGVTLMTDNSGNFIGYLRNFDYGRVIYAPDVGPVLDEERRFAYANQPMDAGAYWLELTLTAVTPGPAPLAAR